ncbi:E3 SUMO-protein ligase SIZ1 isoform X1 [Cryptomeria japonica]|uniref:E3 SUMO-protein ligase SIZ1 isoform X1 n=1 Tax=Cryptomeria japonica TaxID=3369 RepID=UPI0025AD2676|nr:E3 SUMO-protein ligase SIZ1 isoform X1 [Cryptomeria japonica]XP_057852009.1 E3 SUMO-protein ligase SIZ1 isoform X1 [Cryptomeria japonica]XP_057852010.1 E3 SUMO-protein ligase SIZ1 isoform X1 [Cryptomeria japonica]XP_057852011.1 E3 SUMO-protein ligase SIZ1 isoform X1 [Cryptomeria japonica]XP_057852012.1 E3 SUMO-protein ligase SIZ1 isoform X1 [Cryptomeria japonica]XP_057852013.1 E3 SUMO-protein ligase SIZ1 isoform X1 [Cryptomeria japonica]
MKVVLLVFFQDKLTFFRLKELKDVLSRLGLAKQGKKQVLLDRIMAMLSDDKGSKLHGWGNKHLIGKDEVAKIIDDIYRKMNGHEGSELASKNRNATSINVIARSEDIQEINLPEAKTCCPCGSSQENGHMIQCDDPKCGVWQHLGCVIIPENPVEGFQPEPPPQFYCDICRVNRGDPFWVTLSQPVMPTKLVTSPITVDGTNPSQTLDKTFLLTRADRDLLQKTGCELQVWCILLNDKVPFRMHWPQNADLRVNGISIKVTNRPSAQLLGANGRDDGPGITACIREGTNRIALQAYDPRSFALGVRIMRHQTIPQVMSKIPSELEGEPFKEALARVCRCVGGGASFGKADDSDSDLEVVAESVTVNLRCPMTGSRMKVAGRFKPCVHMGCFDLKAFVELNQRARKWQCPICLKNYSLENIIIDPYFNKITAFMEGYSEDVTEVEVKPEGSWRPKLEGKIALAERWHLPDGTIAPINGEFSPRKELPVKVKIEKEGTSGHMSLKIGIKRNHDGCWQVSGAKDMLSSGVNGSGKRGKLNQKVVPASSSATSTNRDDEDPSVNQEGSENPDFSVTNDAGFESPFLDFNNLDTGVRHGSSELPKEPEVIVVSDSEEDNVDTINISSSARQAFGVSDAFAQGISVPLNSSEVLHDMVNTDCDGVPFIPTNSTPVLGSFSEPIPPQSSINSSLGFFGATGAEFSEFPMPKWLSRPQNSTFRLFGADADVSDGTANAHCTSVVRPTPVSSYGFDLGAREQQENTLVESMMPDYNQLQDCPFSSLNTEGNGDLDNSLRGETEDAPLQYFLPPQPARATIQTDYRDRVITSDDVQTDWISLSLGGGTNIDKTNYKESTSAACSRQQSTPEGDGLESLATASVLLNMSDSRAEVASDDNQDSESPFSYHQRPRSARPRQRHRIYFSVNSDSD